jgi:hypothetical protein
MSDRYENLVSLTSFIIECVVKSPLLKLLHNWIKSNLKKLDGTHKMHFLKIVIRSFFSGYHQSVLLTNGLDDTISLLCEDENEYFVSDLLVVINSSVVQDCRMKIVQTLVNRLMTLEITIPRSELVNNIMMFIRESKKVSFEAFRSLLNDKYCTYSLDDNVDAIALLVDLIRVNDLSDYDAHGHFSGPSHKLSECYSLICEPIVYASQLLKIVSVQSVLFYFIVKSVCYNINTNPRKVRGFC